MLHILVQFHRICFFAVIWNWTNIENMNIAQLVFCWSLYLGIGRSINSLMTFVQLCGCYRNVCNFDEFAIGHNQNRNMFMICAFRSPSSSSAFISFYFESISIQSIVSLLSTIITSSQLFIWLQNDCCARMQSLCGCIFFKFSFALA